MGSQGRRDGVDVVRGVVRRPTPPLRVNLFDGAIAENDAAGRQVREDGPHSGLERPVDRQDLPASDNQQGPMGRLERHVGRDRQIVADAPGPGPQENGCRIASDGRQGRVDRRQGVVRAFPVLVKHVDLVAQIHRGMDGREVFVVQDALPEGRDGHGGDRRSRGDGVPLAVKCQVLVCPGRGGGQLERVPAVRDRDRHDPVDPLVEVLDHHDDPVEGRF
ncbi:MAG: hypothetical protein A4E73_00298 [Syntrophaceae bacterium PtaU1.Bin231]|nr:MAG: hypothetical protein A4E73_00298 [Syntrophaceae bacterium PtaU1.Bin231]